MISTKASLVEPLSVFEDTAAFSFVLSLSLSSTESFILQPAKDKSINKEKITAAAA